MCAILDTNAAHEVFGSNAGQATEAGEAFLEWLNLGKGKLVVGGQLREELDQVPGFRVWAKRAASFGRQMEISDRLVDSKTKEIKNRGSCRSNDEHIIALAQASGARLLFSNDKNLHEDFKDHDIIKNPPGKIYSDKITTDKKRFLEKHHCRPRN